MTAPPQATPRAAGPSTRLHPVTAEQIRRGRYETAAQMHCLAGIRFGAILEHHSLPDGRPCWDSISDLPLSSGEEVLRDIAWELGGNRPVADGVLVRAVSWLDDSCYRRVLEALRIRKGWQLVDAQAEVSA